MRYILTGGLKFLGYSNEILLAYSVSLVFSIFSIFRDLFQFVDV